MKSLATALVALGIAGYSAAPSLGLPETSGDERPRLVVSGSGRPLVEASEMSPGAVVRRTVSVANTGVQDGVLSLEIEVGNHLDAGSDLREVLRVDVTDQTGRVLASESVSRFKSRSLLRLQAGEARELAVELRLPRGIGNRYSSSEAAFDVGWALTI